MADGQADVLAAQNLGRLAGSRARLGRPQRATAQSHRGGEQLLAVEGLSNRHVSSSAPEHSVPGSTPSGTWDITLPMSRSTPATIALTKAGVAFDLQTYDYDPGSERVGLQAAEAMGEDPARVLKTLVVLLDGKPACVVLPSDKEVSMKKLAAALGGKSATMMPAPDAERITGYKVGGVSPFGQKKRLPTAVEEAALAQPYVFVNGGQRGLQMRLTPADLIAALGAKAAPVVA